MNKATENGYSMIRIIQEDVYNDANDWECNTRVAIKLYNSPTNIFIGCEKLYQNHIFKYN
jgi:hypothetical protein